ncbi:MAG: histidine phosphatase family protein [Alphaproteobacteria bacterium]|nr:histidine phosphatase family protein [Alphaproteobacteria bacterium]
MTRGASGLPGTNGRRRVYLMRHGEVAYFRADGRAVNPDKVSLTEAGRMQASVMADALAAIAFDRAACSGLPRARETAELVLSGRDLSVEELADFREIKPGSIRNLPANRAEAEFVYGLERAAEPGARFAEGEPYAAFYARISEAFEDLLLSPGWSRLLLVAHDGTNRMILGWACQGGLAAVPAFEQDPGCLNIVDADVIDGRIVRRLIKALNLTPSNIAKHGNYLTSMEQVFFGRRR